MATGRPEVYLLIPQQSNLLSPSPYPYQVATMDSKILFPLNELEQWEIIFGFRTNVPRDVVIFSVDLETNMDNPMHNRYNQITQIRVSMLDTRNPSDPSNNHLTTNHIIVCCGHKRFTHERDRFHFGWQLSEKSIKFFIQDYPVKGLINNSW